VCDHIFAELQQRMRLPPMDLARPVFVIDGTTLRLAHERELRRAFPPGRNQHGENHWPTMLLVAFHDALTGLAMRPSWGAMYGRNNTSEQALAREAVGRLPSDAVAMADSNFGVFWFAYEVLQTQRDVLLRLTRERSQKVLQGEALRPGRRRRVRWAASEWDRRGHRDLPAEATVDGWVVACRNPVREDEILYFFTTLGLIPKRILAIYKLRWNMETDLRSLKRTLELHQLTSKTKAVVEKEVLMAVCAYNVVRATMYLSASQAGLTPRQLSFSSSQDAVMAAWPYLQRVSSQPNSTRKSNAYWESWHDSYSPSVLVNVRIHGRSGAWRPFSLPSFSRQGGTMMPRCDRVDFDSTTLASAIYDHRRNQLQVDFRDGSRYTYSTVAADVFQDLVGSPSKGKFFNRHIRGRFPYAKQIAEN